eukprot:SAG11_NODE_1982_length_3965_cov_11.055872_4_plen_52_part_00
MKHRAGGRTRWSAEEELGELEWAGAGRGGGRGKLVGKGLLCSVFERGLGRS